jgi:hypothetical protein
MDYGTGISQNYFNSSGMSPVMMVVMMVEAR